MCDPPTYVLRDNGQGDCPMCRDILESVQAVWAEHRERWSQENGLPAGELARINREIRESRAAIRATGVAGGPDHRAQNEYAARQEAILEEARELDTKLQGLDDEWVEDLRIIRGFRTVPEVSIQSYIRRRQRARDAMTRRTWDTFPDHQQAIIDELYAEHREAAGLSDDGLE
ncbi:hypothetical protein DL766_009315 [Monosporascus sp. MC13-8B]|uniref:Uncharacterized protein n=1 Tax=Monosporascus cannonballus TaxID=155416 RepID=A0ABY0GTL7_9PEZI|nr:hypothetical protein DL762_009660 [Monosporascus cannonballus]RYO93340.1 hypothetical protein DL763_004439 [Monosporascus cannonballus]RYP15797.1 hypothetical protein DL766_009315 [Monosporascus sp. MC13-8B]